MGLLDELKQEAEAAKRERGRQLSASEVRRQLIEETLRPRMHELYAYFLDLREQLVTLDPDILQDFEIAGVGVLRDLRQGAYCVSTDDPQALDAFSFHFSCDKPGRVEVRKPDRRTVERQKEYLWSHNLRFQLRDSSSDGSGLFLLDAHVPVSIEFSIDADRGGIAVRLRNLHALGIIRHLFKAQRLDQEFMEELAKDVLGRPNRFKEITGNVLSDTTRARLREQIEREKQRRRAATAADAAPERSPQGAGSKFGRSFLGRAR